MPYTIGMFSFVESASFTRTAARYMGDSELQRLQAALLANPTVGAVIPGSGGVRKMRWRRAGGGKRGGLRVLYSLDWEGNTIRMLTVYAKHEQQDIPLHLLRKIRERF